MKTYKHICKKCGVEFITSYYQSTVCENCKKPHKCKCGCGKLTMKIYAPGCHLRNRKYKDIYQGKQITCGFKNGNDNIAKQKDIRQKISDKVKQSYTPELRKLRSETQSKNILHVNMFKFKYKNERNETFRSTLEMNFAELLNKYNIIYKKEVPFKMSNGKYKIVDFKINDVLIEITGFAYLNWQTKFIEKINILRNTSDNPILILTYPDKIEPIRDKLKNNMINLFVESIYNESRIIEKINFLDLISYANLYFNKQYYNNQLIH